MGFIDVIGIPVVVLFLLLLSNIDGIIDVIGIPVVVLFLLWNIDGIIGVVGISVIVLLFLSSHIDSAFDGPIK